MAWPSYDDYQPRAIYVRKRAERLAAARLKGTHTKDEWRALLGVFQECVICRVRQSDCYGNTLCRDHIIPIYQGGCDCIGNIQPLCRECNSRKGPNTRDFRFSVIDDWCSQYLLCFAGGTTP